MRKAWQLRRPIHLRRRLSANVRREPQIGDRGYASTVPEVNSNKGSLLKGESYYTLGKKEGTTLCNSVVASGLEDAGFNVEEETREKCEADVHSAAKLCPGIGKLIIAKCSFIFESGRDTFQGNCSLHDVLKPGLWLAPETLRRFWRASELKPEDFLEILIGFGQGVIQVRNARFLWNLYRWASWQSKDFQHLPRSNGIMVSILADARMLSQAESLLLWLVDNKALIDASGLFSQITQAYSEAGHLDKSVALYDCARYKCLIPSATCYQVLLNLLVRRREDELVLRVYLDMLEVGLGSCTEGDTVDFVVKALVKKDKFLQAISIIRQLKSLDIEISKRSLSTVAKEFCEKDIGDMMNFLEEWRYLPEPRLCNRMLASLCTNLGTDEAWFVFQRLEALGFVPDATTFGIIIFHSCREMKLKAAFLYLSECFSRHIEPKVCAYNAIIRGVFMEGLYRHAKYILEDMIERKIIPEILTYKILLAGYCKYRQFDDIEQILRTMETNGVSGLPSGDCVLSKALSFLGLDHLGVKVKRDNATGFPKSEFFDSVGNGLYLDTDSKKLEISLVQILDNALYPDISSEIVSACQQGNVASALLVKDEAFQWGHDISPAICSELIKALCVSPAHVEDVVDVMEEMPYTFDKFDAQTLNLVAQTLSRNGMSAHGRLVLDRLLRRALPINQDTYTYLLIGFCIQRNIKGFWECLSVATNCSWSPDSKDVMPLINHLCKWGVIEEALELISVLLDCYPNLFFGAYYALLKELCRTGYTSVGCAMLETLLEKGVVVGPSLICNVMEGFLKEQKTAELIGLYDMWLNKSKVSDVFTYQFAFSSLARFDDAERCMDLVQSVMNMECSDVSACSCIVKELLQTGKISQAMSVFQASTLGKKLSGTLLNCFLQSYCCLNNWRKVDAVLCIMLKIHASLSISSYRFLVRRMCEQSQFSSALSLKEMIQDSDKSTDLILYNIMIFCLFQKRNILQVHDLLKDMRGNGISPDKTTYDFLVYGFHKLGDTDRSVNMLDACIAQGLIPSNRSLRIVLSHYCRLGNLDKSLELFHLIERSGWKHGLVIETTLISCLLSCGRHSEAKSCVNKLSRSALIICDTSFDVLINEFCMQGDVEMSVNLLNTMLKKGRLPSEVSYSSVIYRLCILKEFNQALDFLAEMQLANLKPSEISSDALIHGLCAMGRTSDAKKTLEILVTFGSAPSFGMYKIVFDNYCRSNNTLEAAELLHDMRQAGHAPNFEMQWSVISNLSSTDNKTEGYGQPILSNLISSSEFPMKDNKRKQFF